MPKKTIMVKKLYFTAALCFFVTAFSLFTANAQKNKVQTLPDFELKLHNGTTANLGTLKGRVVLLDFWYRGCAGCIQAIPDLIALQEEFKDDLVIIGINHSDIQEDVADYITYKKMNYASTYKSGNNIPKILGININQYPTVLLYDKQGNLVLQDDGFSKGKMNSLRRAIKRAAE